MQTTKGLDILQLRKACAKNHKVRKLFEIYSKREKGRQDCTVPRIRRLMKESGTDLTLDEAIAIMKLWEKAGAGRYVRGDRDQDNRFLWTWDIPSVATRVLSPPAPDGVRPAEIRPAPKTRVKLPKLPPESEVTQVLADAPSVGVKLVTVRFDGFEITLPADMTEIERKEAEKFIRELRAMPKAG